MFKAIKAFILATIIMVAFGSLPVAKNKDDARNKSSGIEKTIEDASADVQFAVVNAPFVEAPDLGEYTLEAIPAANQEKEVSNTVEPSGLAVSVRSWKEPLTDFKPPSERWKDIHLRL